MKEPGREVGLLYFDSAAEAASCHFIAFTCASTSSAWPSGFTFSKM